MQWPRVARETNDISVSVQEPNGGVAMVHGHVEGLSQDEGEEQDLETY